MSRIPDAQDKVCIVCWHELDRHIEEDRWWRCHSLGPDMSQCECRCLKEIGEEQGLEWYNMAERVHVAAGVLKQVGLPQSNADTSG